MKVVIKYCRLLECTGVVSKTYIHVTGNYNGVLYENIGRNSYIQEATLRDPFIMILRLKLI